MIKGNKFMSLPLPDDVINKVNTMGKVEIDNIEFRDRMGSHLQDLSIDTVPNIIAEENHYLK